MTRKVAEKRTLEVILEKLENMVGIEVTGHSSYLYWDKPDFTPSNDTVNYKKHGRGREVYNNLVLVKYITTFGHNEGTEIIDDIIKRLTIPLELLNQEMICLYPAIEFEKWYEGEEKEYVRYFSDMYPGLDFRMYDVASIVPDNRYFMIFVKKQSQ